MLRQDCLLLIASLAAVVSGQSSNCYFPNGSPARAHEPCDEFAFTSVCCPRGWTCFSGKVCVVTRTDVVNSDTPLGTISRGACSSEEWEEGACGEFCLDGGRNGRLTACGENRYCCESDERNGLCDCATGDGTFYKELGTADLIVGFPDEDPMALPTTSRRRTSSRTRASSLTRTPTGTVSETETAETPATTTTSSTPTEEGDSETTSAERSPTSSATLAEDQTENVSVTKTTAFKAGVAVGSSAVGIIIALLLFLCVRSYRKRGGDEDSIISVSSRHIEPKGSMDLREQEVMLGFQDRSDYSITPHPQRSQPRSGAIRWTSTSGQGMSENDSNFWPSYQTMGSAVPPKQTRKQQRGRKNHQQPKYSMLRPVLEVLEPPSKPNSPVPPDDEDQFPSPVSPISPSEETRFSVPRRPLPTSAYQALGLPRTSP